MTCLQLRHRRTELLNSAEKLDCSASPTRTRYGRRLSFVKNANTSVKKIHSSNSIAKDSMMMAKGVIVPVSGRESEVLSDIVWLEAAVAEYVVGRGAWERV